MFLNEYFNYAFSLPVQDRVISVFTVPFYYFCLILDATVVLVSGVAVLLLQLHGDNELRNWCVACICLCSMSWILLFVSVLTWDGKFYQIPLGPKDVIRKTIHVVVGLAKFAVYIWGAVLFQNGFDLSNQVSILFQCLFWYYTAFFGNFALLFLFFCFMLFTCRF